MVIEVSLRAIEKRNTLTLTLLLLSLPVHVLYLHTMISSTDRVMYSPAINGTLKYKYEHLLRRLFVSYVHHWRAYKHGPCLMGLTQLPATQTFYTREDRATPGNNLLPQSSTAVTHCLLVATHFTDPETLEVGPGPLSSEASALPVHPATCFHILCLYNRNTLL